MRKRATHLTLIKPTDIELWFLVSQLNFLSLIYTSSHACMDQKTSGGLRTQKQNDSKQI
jgi:hypothetical protein